MSSSAGLGHLMLNPSFWWNFAIVAAFFLISTLAYYNMKKTGKVRLGKGAAAVDLTREEHPEKFAAALKFARLLSIIGAVGLLWMLITKFS